MTFTLFLWDASGAGTLSNANFMVSITQSSQ
jgi:hypothetical protein